MFQKSQSQQGFFTLNELNIDRNAPFCAKIISKKISKKERQFCKLERILERILHKKQQNEVHLKNEVFGTGVSEKERIYEIPLERHQKFTR